MDDKEKSIQLPFCFAPALSVTQRDDEKPPTTNEKHIPTVLEL